MTSDSQSRGELLDGCRELLRIAKQRPAGILSPLETNKLVTYLERCIYELETDAVEDEEKTNQRG